MSPAKRHNKVRLFVEGRKIFPRIFKNHIISDLITHETVEMYKSKQIQGSGFCCTSAQEGTVLTTLLRGLVAIGPFSLPTPPKTPRFDSQNEDHDDRKSLRKHALSLKKKSLPSCQDGWL